MSELEQRLSQLTPLLAAVRRAMLEEVLRLGFEHTDVAVRDVGDAAYWLDLDPASGEASLMGEWRDDKGMKHGGMAFHADGSFYAEYDVVRIHPTKPRYFVEAVTAWGRDDTIKVEPRLLPMAS